MKKDTIWKKLFQEEERRGIGQENEEKLVENVIKFIEMDEKVIKTNKKLRKHKKNKESKGLS